MAQSFEATIKKIKNKEKLEDMEAYGLMAKGNTPEEKEQIKDLVSELFDYVKFWLEKGLPSSETGKGAYGIVIMLNNSYTNNDDFMFENLPLMLEVMKLIAKNYVLLDKDEDLNNLASILNIPLATHIAKKSQYFSSAVPVFVDLLVSKKMGVNAFSTLIQIQMANARALAAYTEKIIDNVKKCEMAVGLFTNLYTQKPDIFHKRIETLWNYYVSFDTNNKSGILQVFAAIAKGEPKVLTPYINRPEFKDALFSQITGASVLLMIKDYATYDALSLIEWIDDLKDIINQQSWALFSVPYVYGYIGRTSLENGKKMAELLMNLVEKKKNVSTDLLQIFVGIKNIQDYNKDIIQPYIPAIKTILETTTDGLVRNTTQHIIDVAEQKDLKSVNQKVEKNTTDIKEVKTEVATQNTKIENVQTEVKENTAKVKQVEVQVKENKEQIKDVTQRVDKVEVKVDEQGKQIQQILDRFDEMNQKFAGACKNYDELKAYVDKNVDMLKDFVAEVAKKLPTPVKFSAEGYIRRKLKLYFACGLQTDGECLYPKESPYATETSDWAKWLKVGFSLVKLGKALYDKEIFDVVENTKAIYDTFKQKEDQDYMSYISQPFLTSVEQDNLINQLRDQRFFDLFMYSSQGAVWVCTKCGKKELVKRGKIEASPSVSPSNSNPSSPSLPKAAKLSGTLQINVGMFGKMKKMQLEFENDVLTVKNPKNQKVKLTINKKDILNFKEGDVRVTKKENYFSVITKDKTYNLIAETKDQYDSWKATLKV